MKKNQKRMILVLIVTLIMAIILGCGNGKKAYDSEINVYNWGDYIEADDVIKDFEEKYNIKVNYEMYDTNEDMYIKIKQGAGRYDVAIPSDYMIEKMIKEGLLQTIDFAQVPNAQLIDKKFKNLPFDPENRYSVPYMWGTVGILYNSRLIEETPNSWGYLWDEKYTQSIYMLNSQRDAIAVALKYLGYSLNTRNEEELAQAEQALVAQKPLVLAYAGDEVKDQMIQGSAAMAVVWSGDAAYCMAENEDLQYVIPKEGSNYWFDAMVIPTTAQNKEGAELFINYMCETQVALANTRYIGYSTPHTGVFAQLPTEVSANRNFYLTDEDLANNEIFHDLADFLPKYDEIWSRIQAN